MPFFPFASTTKTIRRFVDSRHGVLEVKRECLAKPTSSSLPVFFSGSRANALRDILTSIERAPMKSCAMGMMISLDRTLSIGCATCATRFNRTETVNRNEIQPLVILCTSLNHLTSLYATRNQGWQNSTTKFFKKKTEPESKGLELKPHNRIM